MRLPLTTRSLMISFFPALESGLTAAALSYSYPLAGQRHKDEPGEQPVPPSGAHLHREQAGGGWCSAEPRRRPLVLCRRLRGGRGE